MANLTISRPAPDRSLEKKDWYQRNRERILSRAKERYHQKLTADPVGLRKEQHRRHNENRQRINARQRARRALRSEQRKLEAREWRRENRELSKLISAQYKAKRLECAFVPVAVEDWENTLAAFSRACAYCAGPYEQMDHVLPLERGGPHCLANLVPSCRRCNSSKHAHFWFDWYAAQTFFNQIRCGQIVTLLEGLP